MNDSSKIISKSTIELSTLTLTKKAMKIVGIPIIFLGLMISYLQPVQGQSASNKKDSAKPPNLIFPMLLEKEKRLAGNPLATYASIVEMEKEYRSSPFAPVYDEIRYSFEEFLGFPEAGKKALGLPQFRTSWKGIEELDVKQWSAAPLLEVIREEANKTRVVIWGEEHHLPQTRSPFEGIIKELWKLGYRYIAAEAFTEGFRDSAFKFTTYTSGFYTQDPVFASALNLAHHLGFQFIDYDSKEMSQTEPSLRDIRQAENIVERILKKDSSAKVLIIAGRGHASEVMSGGWKPMAFNLKQLTGIDPFTMMAQTMTERMTTSEEHPYYTKAIEAKLIKGITILKNKKNGNYLGSDAFDVFVFFPRTTIKYGRPDWLFSTMLRKPVELPFSLAFTDGLYLVQAFFEYQPYTAVPVDQFVITKTDRNKCMALMPGKYKVRVVDKTSNVLSETLVSVE